MFSCTTQERLHRTALIAAVGALLWVATAVSQTPAASPPAAQAIETTPPPATSDAAATPDASATSAATTTDAPAPHAWQLRELRDPPPDIGALPPPTVPEVFTGTFPGARPYTIVPRVGTPALPLHPCVMCHDLRKPDPTPRVFKVAPPPDGAPHAARLRHGGGRFWCVDCHDLNDRQWLRTLDGRKLDFNDAPVQCGQCHSARYRDWVFGAHGKRVAGWNGERQLYSCVQCHDPHIPVLPARKPSPPPPVRAGLQPMLRTHTPSQGHVDGPQARR